jgi:hypothetical protein
MANRKGKPTVKITITVKVDVAKILAAILLFASLAIHLK